VAGCGRPFEKLVRDGSKVDITEALFAGCIDPY
jgi:hypothetical protein